MGNTTVIPENTYVVSSLLILPVNLLSNCVFTTSLSLSHTHTQLVMGEEAVLTFGCGTFIEREEWTEAFRILNQLAPAFVGSQLATMTPIKGKLHDFMMQLLVLKFLLIDL